MTPDSNEERLQRSTERFLAAQKIAVESAERWEREHRGAVRYWYIYDASKHVAGPLATLRASSEASAIQQAEKRWPEVGAFKAVDIGEPSDQE